jgi:hypothetical protein
MDDARGASDDPVLNDVDGILEVEFPYVGQEEATDDAVVAISPECETDPVCIITCETCKYTDRLLFFFLLVVVCCVLFIVYLA